jgi:hypothetical protein
MAKSLGGVLELSMDDFLDGIPKMTVFFGAWHDQMKGLELTLEEATDVADAYLTYTGIVPESIPVLFDIIEINHDITCKADCIQDIKYWDDFHYEWIEKLPKDPSF